jgi:superfamily II DNA or RNA helicase
MNHTDGFDFGEPPLSLAKPVDRYWMDTVPSVVSSIFRDYQTTLYQDIGAAMHKWRRILAQAPCRSGKTMVFCGMAKAGADHGFSVLILATRTKLVRQINDRMDSLNIRHGVIAAEMPGHRVGSALIQVASVDTLYRRCFVDKKMPLPPADIVIFDEAHLALGASRQLILDGYLNSWKFGFTATPIGKRLRDQFDGIVIGPEISTLLRAGAVVPPHIYNKPQITVKEHSGLKVDSKGEFKTGQVSKLMSRPKIIGDVVQNWLAIANGEATLVFACDKAHGAFLLTEFTKAGVSCEQLTDADDDDTREDVLRRSEAGITKVVINCFLMSYGVDLPWIKVVVLARPIRTLTNYLQSVWRGGTPYPGKTFFKVIDHGRVIDTLREPTYDRDWVLESNLPALKRVARNSGPRVKPDESPRTCSDCTRMWLVTTEGANCPDCGWIPKPLPLNVQVTDAMLGHAGQELPPIESVQEFYQQAVFWMAQRYPDKWEEKPNSLRFRAWCETRVKYKRPEDERIPRNFWSLPKMPASDATSGWLKHRVIRYAKAADKRRKEAAEMGASNA